MNNEVQPDISAPTELFGLVVRFELAPGHEEAFDALTAETLIQIREAEPGTIMYACHTVEGQPRARIFYELYAGRAAFDAHEQQPHVKRFLSEREAHFETVPRVEFFSSTAGKNIPTEV